MTTDEQTNSHTRWVIIVTDIWWNEKILLHDARIWSTYQFRDSFQLHSLFFQIFLQTKYFSLKKNINIQPIEAVSCQRYRVKHQSLTDAKQIRKILPTTI